MIFCHDIGYLNCTKLLINNSLLQDRQLVKLNHCPNLLIIILSKIKDGLKRYDDNIYSRNSVNQMWILKSSKELLGI